MSTVYKYGAKILKIGSKDLIIDEIIKIVHLKRFAASITYYYIIPTYYLLPTSMYLCIYLDKGAGEQTSENYLHSRLHRLNF